METNAKQRPLTLLRLLRGITCLVVFISTALMFLLYFSPAAALARLISVNLSRKTASLIFSHWLALWPFFFEKINGTKVVFSGDEIPPKERALLIANHRTEVDWMYLWNLAHRKGALGRIKYVLKSSLMKLPIFGWGFHMLEFVSVERKWEVDEPALRRKLSSFRNPNDPLWLALFPEGTDFTEEKCAKSKMFAAEGNLPILSNVLLPKAKGFCVCMQILRSSLDAVYDVSIAYKFRCPNFMDNVFGVNPMEVHLHVRRISVEDIPATEKGGARWLLDAFELKDKLLGDFKTKGKFPEGRTEESLSTVDCLVNCVIVILLTCVFAYLTYYSFWSRVYVVVSCAYLATVAYFDIHPVSFSLLLEMVLGEQLKR